jgi:ribosomal protein S1
MADLLAMAKTPIKAFKVADRVQGTIIAITPKALILDIGGKSEGMVTEKALIEARDLVKTLKVGDKVNTVVLVPEARDGSVLLSLRHAANEAIWENIDKLYKSKELVTVVGRSVSPAGVTVEFEGLYGFIPASQLGRDTAKNMEELVDQHFKAIIIEMDRRSNKVVFSEREVSEAKEIKVAKVAMEKIKDGEIYDGVVTTVTTFGCFVKLEIPDVQIEGLVHISEIAWEKIGKVSDVFKEGDKVKVKVIGLRNGKISLSIKQALKDPWETVEEKYKPETKFKGKVVKVSDFGLFVQIEPGLEGLIHMTKIPPAMKLNTGDEVNCYIEEVNTKERKISLGLVLTAKPIKYK